MWGVLTVSPATHTHTKQRSKLDSYIILEYIPSSSPQANTFFHSHLHFILAFRVVLWSIPNALTRCKHWHLNCLGVYCPLVAEYLKNDSPSPALGQLHSAAYLCLLLSVSQLFGLRCYKIHVQQPLLCFCTLHCLRPDSFADVPKENSRGGLHCPFHCVLASVSSEMIFSLLYGVPQHQSGAQPLSEGPEVPLKSVMGLFSFQKFIGEVVHRWHEAKDRYIFPPHNQEFTGIEFYNRCLFLPAQWCVSDSKNHGSVH